jgi:hypothetical protein
MGEKGIRLAVALVVGCCVSASCVSVKPVVIDRRAQLEKQIIGTLARLESELILESSVRGPNARRSADTKPVSPHRTRLVAAQQGRAYRKDDVLELKKLQLVAEGRRGRLLIVKPPSEPAQRKQLDWLVTAENADRDQIIRSVLALSVDLAPSDEALVRDIFFRLQVRSSRAGDLVQKPDGRFEPLTARSSKASQARDLKSNATERGRP